jgi:uncharacterized integral membrane protein
MQATIIFGIAVALLGVLFAVQNNVPVTVVFLAWRFDSWLALVILVAALLGALVIALVSMPAALRARWQIARQQRQIEQLQRRIDELERRPAATAVAAIPSSPAAAAQRPVP